MTRFEESALRNSVCEEANPSTLPYWHPSSQFSALIDSQQDTGASHGNNEQSSQPISYPPFSNDQIPVSSQHSVPDFSLSDHQRDTPFSQFDEFAQLPQQISQALNAPGPSTPAMPQYGQSLTVKTPTGARSMRRPGLAGAAALINGQYCCQWSAAGSACRHKFLDAKSLNDHIRTHHVRGASSFVCCWSGCDKGAFPTANKLVRHVHSHTGYKPFPCPTCSLAFVTKDQLDKHLTTHTGAKDFVCSWPGCGRSFAVKHALDGHMNSVHLKAKKHVCPHCAQAFDDSSNLSKHKKQVHNPDTGIRCPARHTHACPYVDSRKDKMKEHCERMCHGLETVSNPHAWSLWVQQFKTAAKKSESRRQSILSASPMSRVSSTSMSTFSPVPRRTSSLECSKQGCNIPVCLPCNILCNDVHSAYGSLQPCDEPDCDPCDPYDPCEPCDDPACNESVQVCTMPPCTIPHCRSGSSTPTQPATPHCMPPSYFGYPPIASAEGDLFQDSDHPFQLGTSRLSDYMFVNR